MEPEERLLPISEQRERSMPNVVSGGQSVQS